MKKLSVIMPVYNAEQWIGETIESVLAQIYTDWELICVNDSSPDNSAEIIKEYAERDSRIILLNKPNGGVSSARNFGIDHATGDYIAFLDADDIAKPEMYATLVSLLEKEDSDCSFCAFTRFFVNGKTLTTIETSLEKLKLNPHDIKYFFYSTPAVTEGDTLTTADVHGSSCRSIFKTDIIKEKNIRFIEGCRFSEDQVFVVEYLQACKKISFTHSPLLLYRAQTKAWVHHNLYESDMMLIKRQLELLDKNDFYSKKEKRKIAAYLKYSAYMMVINEDLMFKADAYKIIPSYGKDFDRLLTFGGLIQKMKSNFDVKKVALYFMLKLRMYKLVQKTFPNKKY